MNATTRIHDSLTFLGATWVGHELALYLELDQCSNSRTHQDLAPTKTHMEVHILSNGIKQPRLRTELKYTVVVPNRTMETKLETQF